MDLARFTLSWLATSFRTLSLYELEEARHITVGSRALRSDLKPYNLRRSLKQACGSFVRILDDGLITISHFSAKEYLLQCRDFLQSSASIHREIGRSCLTYVFLDVFKDMSHQVQPLGHATHPLSEYATRYWHAHLLRSSSPPSPHEIRELSAFFTSPQFKTWIVNYDRVFSNAINHTFSLHEIRSILSSLRDWISGLHTSLGSSQELALVRLGEAVREAFHQQLRCTQTVMGDQSEENIRLLWFLARLERDEGHLAEAERLFQKALQETNTVLGLRNPQALYARNEYARQLSDTGRNSEAAKLFEETLALLEDQLGSDHEFTLRTADSLAYHYTVQGNESEATLLFRRSIAGNEKVLGKLHPNTLAPITSLGFYLSSYGRWEEAEPVLQLALHRTKLAFDERHPYHLTAIINLGWLRLIQQKHKEARILFETAVEGRERIFGSGHPETCGAQRFLALVHVQLGDEERARSLYAGPSKEENQGFFIHMFQTKVKVDEDRHWEGLEKVYQGAVAARRNRTQELISEEHGANTEGV